MWVFLAWTWPWSLVLCLGGCAEDDTSDQNPPSNMADAGAGFGSACQRNADCTGGKCSRDRSKPAEDLSPVGLICGEESSGLQAGKACDTSDACAQGLCVIAGTCVSPCQTDGDCGNNNQRCMGLYARTAKDALQPFRGCVQTVSLPSGVAFTQTPIKGDIAGGDQGGIFGFEIDASRTNHVIVLPSADTYLRAVQFIVSETPPRTLFDAAQFEDAFAANPNAPAPLTPINYGVTPVSFLFPYGPLSQTTVTNNRFTLTVQSTDPTSVSVINASRKTTGSKLNLNIFYVGVPDWGPTGARGPAELADALTEVEQIYQQGGSGISLGTVNQYEITGALALKYAFLEIAADDSIPEFEELLRLSGGANNPAINLFFIRSIEGGTSNSNNSQTIRVLGQSGGSPGPQGVHGTRGSGVVIAVETVTTFSKIGLGRTLAHEIGHHLGLFHTSEQKGIVLEPLNDTPECRISRDGTGSFAADSLLSPDECGIQNGNDGGATNLMFFSAQGNNLSPQQANVLHSAMILQ